MFVYAQGNTGLNIAGWVRCGSTKSGVGGNVKYLDNLVWNWSGGVF